MNNIILGLINPLLVLVPINEKFTSAYTRTGEITLYVIIGLIIPITIFIIGCIIIYNSVRLTIECSGGAISFFPLVFAVLFSVPNLIIRLLICNKSK